MVGCSKVTVLRLLADVGTFCADYHDLMVRNLQSKRVQADEICSFCGCKARTQAKGGQGHDDVWTWTAMDADSKLMVSYFVSDRSGVAAKCFMTDLASRLANRVQPTGTRQTSRPSR